MNYNKRTGYMGGHNGGDWQGPGHMSGQGPRHGHGQAGPGVDPNLMMQQIQQLQQTVRELQTGGGGGGGFGGPGGPGGFNPGFGGPRGLDGHRGHSPGTQGMSNYRAEGRGGGGGTWSNNSQGNRNRNRGERTKNEGEGNINEDEQTVLLVSNIPPNLSNPDSLFYAFEKFGTVTRVKILHNKRNTALIQMSQPAEAQKAIEEQESLNRVGNEIYVNFSSKFTEIRLPEPGSLYDDGLTKDFTGEWQSMAQGPPKQFGGFDDSFGGNGGGPMFNMGRDGGGPGFGNDGYDGFNGPRNQGAGLVLLLSNLPDEVANVDSVFNMCGVYGDVMFVKILRNKRDCCMVQMAKPHHAQQLKVNLDHAKIGGNKLCISYSRVENLFLQKNIPDDDELQRNFVNSRNHRFRQKNTEKLQKNLGPPTSTLHVANLPEGFTHTEIKELFIEKGFTVKESNECGSSGNMAFLNMPSPDEALMALAVMHNYAPQELKFKNSAGLCVSFSKRNGQA